MGKETVEYYLLECRTYKEQRKKIIKDIGKGRPTTNDIVHGRAYQEHKTARIIRLDSGKGEANRKWQ
jgi:hypothetical protein